MAIELRFEFIDSGESFYVTDVPGGNWNVRQVNEHGEVCCTVMQNTRLAETFKSRQSEMIRFSAIQEDNVFAYAMPKVAGLDLLTLTHKECDIRYAEMREVILAIIDCDENEVEYDTYLVDGFFQDWPTECRPVP